MNANTKKKKKKRNGPVFSIKLKIYLIILFLPITITLYIAVYILWAGLSDLPLFKSASDENIKEYNEIQANFDIPIPRDYVPIYMEAAEKYNIPWTLLAAHHRIETRFSTMKSLVSPAGAEGHMQFMPCTFVGWDHPTCEGLGEGDIPENEKKNPAVIDKYGGYGVDANGDGIADPYDIEDAIHSAARYLANSGAKAGEIKKAVFAYNHSEEYVEDVLYYYNLYNDQKRAIEINLMDE